VVANSYSGVVDVYFEDVEAHFGGVLEVRRLSWSCEDSPWCGDYALEWRFTLRVWKLTHSGVVKVNLGDVEVPSG
jgi:hypothetical protein